MLTIGNAVEKMPGECRLAITPEIAIKYKGLGTRVILQKGLGRLAHVRDSDYANVEFFESSSEIYNHADIVLGLQAPSLPDIDCMRPGTILVGLIQPWSSPERIKKLTDKNITCFSLELLPRISRAQSMDVLSSQAAVAGYECVLIAAGHCTKFFPMLTYAAGTVRPAKVLVVGAGVAGLQAIATAKRLGAMVSGYDVRAETKEQIESLGAKFIDTGVSASDTGGYARELNTDELRKQKEKLSKAITECDALITTAAIPGKKAPLIVSSEMVAGMKPGSVIVDMAAESGGNVAGSVAGEKVWMGETLVIGPTNIASRMPAHASEMYAKNLFNFVSLFIKDGSLTLDWSDEVMAGTCLTHAGEIRHAGVRLGMGL